MTDNEENRTAIIPDFFFEIIGRITSGLLVIALFRYWSGSDFEAVFSSVGLSVFVFAAAWIIGITLDMGIFSIGTLIRFEKLLPPFPSSEDYWKYVHNVGAWERGIIHKVTAQVIFFRNMMSICALTTLICIIMEYSSRLNSLLPLLFSHHRRYAILGIVFSFVFMSCWWAQRKTLTVDWQNWLEIEHARQKPDHLGKPRVE